jgi:phosphatidate cytidylyltransferase
MKMNIPTLVLLGTVILLAMYTGMIELMRTSGKTTVLMLFLIPWIADTAAYIFGKLFGKHKLIPHISPGKTWEGLFGAVIGSMVLLPLYAYIVLDKEQVSVFFFVAILMLVIISVIGDLFESYIKRTMGVKDSGNILPGHGGLLDRLDSLIAVAPCFMMLVKWGWV